MPALPQRAAALIGRIDPGLWVALCIAALAAVPFLTRPSLETFTDAEMHVYRAAQVEASIRAGVLYPRWAPDLFFGYGYPVFNYYSPLTYHLAAWYSILTGTDVVAGVKFAIVLGFALGAAGMYLFLRDRWSGVAGAVGAAAFSLAPYTLYINPHARGDVPEFFAISLAPWALWASSRLRRSNSPGDAAMLAVAMAAVILSHPLMGIVFFGLLLAWAAWEMAFGHSLVLVDGRRRPRPVRLAVLAVLLGLGLSAVLWLPAVLERSAVQLHNTAGPGFFDFHRNFLDPAELFSTSPIFDYGATEPRFNFNLGPAQWMLAALGFLTVFHPRIRRPSVLFFALVGVVLIYLMLPSSAQVWEAIPPMSYFQFPSRFLGPSALVLGVLGAASLGWSERLPFRWARNAFGIVAVAACLVGALPHLFPRPWAEFGPVTVQRMLDVELDGRAVGTTSGNDFLPSTADIAPRPIESLIRSYRTTGVPDKVNRATLPAGTEVTLLDRGPTWEHFRVRGAEPFVLRLFTFHFPGWTAYVDGVEAPIEVAKPEGFITVPLPAGEHDVVVRFENTLARWLGWGVTAIAVAGVAWLLFSCVRHRERIASPPGLRLAPGVSALLLAILLATAGFRALADSLGWYRVTSTGDRVLVAERQMLVRLENNLEFLGYDLPRRQARAGGDLSITLYWKASGDVPRDYQVFVHLMGPDGKLWGQSDKLNPADFPTTRWPTDQYVRDEHEAILLRDAPEGEYRVVVGLWDQTTGARLNAWAPDGTRFGDGVELPERIRVER